MVWSYLGQVDIGHNDTVQRTWSILWWVSRVSSRVILVPVQGIRNRLPSNGGEGILEVVSSLVTLRASCLPWHTALRNIDLRLGGGGGGLAACKDVN